MLLALHLHLLAVQIHSVLSCELIVFRGTDLSGGRTSIEYGTYIICSGFFWLGVSALA